MTKDNKSGKLSRAMKEKIRRQNRPEELKEKERERNRISTQKRRMNESEEEKEARREKQRIMQRIARMNESAEARAQRLENGRIRAKFRRLNESCEQRKSRLEKERLNARIKRMMESPEQKEVRRKRDTLRQKEKRHKQKIMEIIAKNETSTDNSFTDSTAESIIIQPEIIHEVFGTNLFNNFVQENQDIYNQIESEKNQISDKIDIQETNLLFNTLKSNKIEFNIKNSISKSKNINDLPKINNPYLLLEANNKVKIKEEICSLEDEDSKNFETDILKTSKVQFSNDYTRYTNKDRNFVSLNTNLDKVRSKIIENTFLKDVKEPNIFNNLESPNSIQQFTKDMFQRMQIIGEVGNGIFIARLFDDLFIIDKDKLNEQFLKDKKETLPFVKKDKNVQLKSFNKDNIIDEMSKMNQPWICPHGHPTLKHFYKLNCSNI